MLNEIHPVGYELNLLKDFAWMLGLESDCKLYFTPGVQTYPVAAVVVVMQLALQLSFQSRDDK